MAQYDPQRSRPRQKLSDEEPAPVDALLEPHPAKPDLPDGVVVAKGDEDDVSIQAGDAEVEITSTGDDVIVHTPAVEVRVESDEVVVSRDGDEIRVDLSQPVGKTPLDPRRIAVVTATIVAVVVIITMLRRRSTR